MVERTLYEVRAYCTTIENNPASVGSGERGLCARYMPSGYDHVNDIPISYAEVEVIATSKYLNPADPYSRESWERSGSIESYVDWLEGFAKQGELPGSVYIEPDITPKDPIIPVEGALTGKVANGGTGLVVLVFGFIAVLWYFLFGNLRKG